MVKKQENNHNKKDDLWAMRHSAEHVLTMAMMRLYGPEKVIMAMGPATDTGFYFDFDTDGDFSISENDFEKIEAEMNKIIKEDLPFQREEIDIERAKELFTNNPYKMEWISEIEKQSPPTGGATIYRTGKEFVDLCAGPHTTSTGQIGPIKLLSVAGAYWRGDENNKMLTRVYGTAFPTQKELDNYLDMMEQAKARDHRKLGKVLDLFTFSDLVGSGLPLYTPKGTTIRRLLNSYIEELQSAQDYTQVWTPQIAKAELFKTSGHYEKYKDDMFRVVSNYSEEEFYLKPMNCPQHTQIYASQPRSYKELPIRYSDFAMLYRDEKPGELLGLARVRAFSTDDTHVFCTEDQVEQEIDTMLQMTKRAMETFGLQYRYRMSIRDPNTPEKYLGDPKTWDKLEKWGEEIMKVNNIDHFDAPGEASFYAPKMDLLATDSLGREWQLSTVQIDCVMPERFGLKYTDTDGSEKTPYMIHRAILGSTERFMNIIIEHFAGAFPAWLSPTQVKILPITDEQLEYAQKILSELKQNGIRVDMDEDSSTLQAKIRSAQLEKVPYMMILGAKEMEAENVSIRLRTGENINGIKLDTFIERIKDKIQNKSLEL